MRQKGVPHGAHDPRAGRACPPALCPFLLIVPPGLPCRSAATGTSLRPYLSIWLSVKASAQEITLAKNKLAKRYHPDVNMRNGIDTTDKMQEILEAYLVLSDPVKRAEYDREIRGNRPSKMQTFNLYEESEEVEDPDHPTFVTYWKAAGALYDIIEQSNALFHQRENAAKLGELAIQALHHIILLREAKIPERYWYPDIMNWLLFKWYQNRNYNLAYLLKLYDEHEKNDMNKIEKLKLQNRAYRYQHSVKKLLRY